MRNDVRILLCIATFNEIENLPRLVAELCSGIPLLDIVVIDDDSPDGTWEWVRNQADNPRLSLIHRTRERGLGSATIRGLERAITDGYTWVATMDADFSHDPEDLAGMVEIVRAGNVQFDVMLGSRYTRGGGIEGWPFHRRIASRFVNGLARIWLGLATRDNTGAFRIYRTEALETIELQTLHSDGYGYLEEILFRLQNTGAKIVEHPITFRDREQGQSKSSIKVGVEVVWNILTMRFRQKSRR